MTPGDIIFWRDEKLGHHRFWEIKGVFLGAVGQESLIELRSLTEKAGDTYGGLHETTFVPEPLLRNAALYTRATP